MLGAGPVEAAAAALTIIKVDKGLVWAVGDVPCVEETVVDTLEEDWRDPEQRDQPDILPVQLSLDEKILSIFYLLTQIQNKSWNHAI